VKSHGPVKELESVAVGAYGVHAEEEKTRGRHMSDTRYEHLMEMLKQAQKEPTAEQVVAKAEKNAKRSSQQMPVNEVAEQLKKLFKENIGSLVLDKEFDFESHMTIRGRNRSKVTFSFQQVWRVPHNYEIGQIKMTVRLGFFRRQQEMWEKYRDGICNPTRARNTFFSDKDWDDFDKLIRGQMKKLIASKNGQAHQNEMDKATNLLKEVCGDEPGNKIVAQLIHKDM
jgi:hypothetical protein